MVPDKPPKTPTDPVEWVIGQAKKRTGKLPTAAVAALDTLISPTKGVFLIEESDEDDQQEKQPGAIIAVKGKFNWVRGFAAAQGPAARMAKIAKNMGYVAKKLGAPETVPMEVTLFNRGDGLDLEFAFRIIDTWQMTGELFPVVKPRAAFKELNFKMHAKLAGKVPEFSVEAEGVGFAQMTSKDPWVALTPGIEINNEGEITFGGAFSGACPSEPTKDTEAEKTCKGLWDVFKLGRISATGGSLRITMEGDVPKGIEASILNGRLGTPNQPGGIEVTGAIRGEAKLKPGFGLVLKTSGTPKMMDFINAVYGPYMQAGGSANPLSVVYSGLNKLPNPSLPLSQQADIIITPTGFVVENFNYPDPQVYVNARASSAGIALILESQIKADPEKVLKGDLTGALPNGYIRFTENNDTFNDEVRKIADVIPLGGKVVGFIMDKGFTFNAITGTITITNGRSEGKASLVYTLGGTSRSFDDIPIGDMFEGPKLARYVLDRFVNILTDPPEWMKKIPGATEALKAAGFVIGETLKGVGIAAGAVIDLGSQALASLEAIFSESRDTSKDALHKNVPPFRKEQVLSIMCALEGQRCAFDGKRLVAYGAAGRFIFKENVEGGIACTTSNFGGRDPLPGSTKACYYPANMAAPTNVCGQEGGKCGVSGAPQDIYYGINPMYAVKRCVVNTVECSNSSFGADPTYGGTKSCYAQKSDCVPTQTFNFKCAREGSRCIFDGVRDVAYGRDGVWVIKRSVNGSINCDTGTFGGADPVPGVKYCYIQAPDLAAPQAGEKCVDEGKGACVISSQNSLFGGVAKKLPPQDVYFGADGAYAVKRCVSSGGVSCDSAAFGGDPAAGFAKACYMRNSDCQK